MIFSQESFINLSPSDENYKSSIAMKTVPDRTVKMHSICGFLRLARYLSFYMHWEKFFFMNVNIRRCSSAILYFWWTGSFQLSEKTSMQAGFTVLSKKLSSHYTSPGGIILKMSGPTCVLCCCRPNLSLCTPAFSRFNYIVINTSWAAPIWTSFRHSALFIGFSEKGTLKNTSFSLV